jgi:NAD-dependent dihydropyrimidine dehydrogenase PreA subunit
MAEMEMPELQIPGPFAEWVRSVASGERSIPNAEGERHHYTPQFVLKKFQGPARKLFQLDKRDGSCVEVKPKDAAWAPNLYAVETDDGQHDGIIEGFISVAENFAAPSLGRLLNAPASFTDEDRGNLAFLLAIQEQRAPGWLVEFEERIAQAGTMWATVELANRPGAKGMKRRAREAAAALTSGAVTIKPTRGNVLGMTLMGLSATVGPAYGLPWTLYRAREGAFITSDRPLTMHDPNPPHKFSGAAWMSSDFATVTMPLSSKACLRTCPSDPHRFAERYTSRQVERINLRTYGWATRYVYGRSAELLEDLHARAVTDPGAVPAPTKKRHVILEDLSTADPAVAERNRARGWDPYLSIREEDGSHRVVSYEVIDSDEDARRVVSPRAPRGQPS